MPPDDVAACLGLISDTHCPDRLDRLPEPIFEIFRGVDLILHAGDVGALDVLDQLSAVAPVVAVHGNDEAVEETQRELPYQQVLMIAGQRIVLTHAHHPDRDAEMELRKTDAWEPKLDRWASFAQRADAGILVHGHTHIPCDLLHQGVRIVNPGAIASGNVTTRQFRKTVALLYILRGGESHVAHVDLARPDAPLQLAIEWEAGFRAAMLRFQETILDERSNRTYERIRETARALGPDAYAAAREIMRQACMPYWTGGRGTLSAEGLVRAVESTPGVPTGVRDAFLAAASTGA